MEQHIEDVVSQQISAAIEALGRAKNRLESDEAQKHLDVAASIIHDAQFNVLLLKAA